MFQTVPDAAKPYADVLHLLNYSNSWVSSSEYFCFEGLSSLAGSGNWNLLFSHRAERMQSATSDAQLTSATLMDKGHFNACRSYAWWKSEHRVCSLLALRGDDICRCKATSDLIEWIIEAGQMGGKFQDQGQSFPNMLCNWNDCNSTGKECRTSSNLWLDLLATFISNSIPKDTTVLCVHSSLSLGKEYLSFPIHLQSSQLSIKYQLTFYLLYEIFPNSHEQTWMYVSTLDSPDVEANIACPCERWYLMLLCTA